ncbi:MAG: DUF5056 domain-containing protein [Halobacteriovoraceae bacterium]|nr:DUF5056 domain-containing protein [Halobacteriovoraceae bacterium]
MNDNELDALLSEKLSDQQMIEDNGFTENVMYSLPAKTNHKLRALVLLSSTSIGSLSAFFLMGGTSKNFLREVFQGLTKYNHGGLAMVLGVILLYTVLYISTSEEIS